MFHRQIRERGLPLAPFLECDQAPHMVMAGGELYWIITDTPLAGQAGYTTRFLTLIMI